jgi:hypothetical protein
LPVEVQIVHISVCVSYGLCHNYSILLLFVWK